MEEDGDERSVELSTIQAIFPEIAIDPGNPFAASLTLAITPAKPFAVKFPPLANEVASASQLLTTPSSSNNLEVGKAVEVSNQPAAKFRQLSHLPPLNLEITLPTTYPSDAPPAIRLSSEWSWVPQEKLEELQGKAEQLWEENGRSVVLYDYIDFIQQAADDGFGLMSQEGFSLTLPQNLEVVLLDYNLRTKRERFEQETFDCGICLEPKKGLVCHRLQLCSHVFCVECLQDFYNNCIIEGDITQVKCLAPDCEKDFPVPYVQGAKRKQKVDRTLDPSELLQIPIDQDRVQRYVTIKRKKRLESNKNTIYCPRKWCQGPARTSKGRDGDEDSGMDEDRDQETHEPIASRSKPNPPSERLAICEDCTFAFCSVCKASWHGDFERCFPRKQHELTAEERASEEYLKAHSTPCPTCNARCQKTMGCNHMICFQCKSHFCYLCSSWLSAENPYLHFNTKWQPCYQRLWELEEGDGVGDPRPVGINAAPPEIHFEEDEDEDEDDLQHPPPAPIAPAHGAGAQRQWQAQGVRINRRAQQGLARPPPVPQNRGGGLQRFLNMAAADREDEWDSDELDSDEDEGWRLP